MDEQTERVRSLFDDAVTEYVTVREAEVSFRAQKALALRMLEGARGRLLDAGCGPALMAPALLERGFEVWGVDASTRMIEAARRRMEECTGGTEGRACHLSLGDITRLDFADGFFDAALSMGVLEYLPDYAPALSELRRVLKPGGIAVLTVPQRLSPYHALSTPCRRLQRFLRPPAVAPLEIHRCVPALLDRLCGQLGLRKLEGRGCNFIFFPLHDLWPRGSAALSRRLSPLSATAAGVLLGSQYVLKLQKA